MIRPWLSFGSKVATPRHLLRARQALSRPVHNLWRIGDTEGRSVFILHIQALLTRSSGMADHLLLREMKGQPHGNAHIYAR